MKKTILFLILITSSLISCSSDGSSSSANANFKWSCRVDGVLYSWQGTNIDVSGSCIFSELSNNVCSITMTNSFDVSDPNTINISINIPGSGNTGTFNIDSNSSSNYNFTLGGLYGLPMVHSVYQSTDGVVVKINSITNSNIQSGILGKVKGTFSGRVSNYNGTSVNITNGSFEAMNANY
jgi:hypothetical protein